jgi:hypothetical protein
MLERTSKTLLRKWTSVFPPFTSLAKYHTLFLPSARVLAPVIVCVCLQIDAAAAEKNAAPRTTSALPVVFNQAVKPILNEYCITCHSTEKQKGDLDLERFKTFDDIKRDPAVWDHALEQVRDKEMPPKDKPQPSAQQRQILTDWLHSTLDEIALADAGDPGSVVLRRLSNMEYTYSVRDLTGVEQLDPAREFPVDGAAGEGFTNAAAALVMSPSLLGKYLDAAKEVAAHAVLTGSGIRFSKSVSQRDWTNETLSQLQAFYARFTQGEVQKIEVGGASNVTTKLGTLPLQRYLDALQRGGSREGLSAKYLKLLDAALREGGPSVLLENLRAKYRSKTLTAADIEPWQKALWKLNNIGHLGKVGGPKSWMEAVTPLAASQEIRVKLDAPDKAGDVLVYLSAGDAGDGNADDYALWDNPHIVAKGRPDLSLRDIGKMLRLLSERRAAVLETTVQCLAAAHEAESQSTPVNLTELARKHSIQPEVLEGWLSYVGITADAAASVGQLLAKKMLNTPDYNFVRGWTGDSALSVTANSSDQTVKVPGTMKPHSVAMHPSPKLSVGTGWRSPVAGKLRITGSVQDVHTACGNGVTWSLQQRHGNARHTLASGTTKADRVSDLGTHWDIRVEPGDIIAVMVSPGNGDHACDLTAVELVLNDGTHEWNLAKELSPDILAGNPHADAHGNKDVWSFFSEPAETVDVVGIPKDSLLARWRAAKDAGERQRIAVQIQNLLRSESQAAAKGSPDDLLRAQIMAPGGPLLGSALRAPRLGAEPLESPYGLAASLFGVHPGGAKTEPNQICVKAPSLIEVRLPAALVDGAELVASARLHPSSGADASVQMRMTTSKPEMQAGLQATDTTQSAEKGSWTGSQTSVSFGAPVLVQDGSGARARFEAAFREFRDLFPIALCYNKIVPVDEVVTLTLFHREDEPLSRLMLEDAEKAELERLWAELHFVSEDALTLVDAFEQIWQFSTQDGPDKPNGDKRLEPLREPIMRGAEKFKKTLAAAEPVHVDAVLSFAARAWRRPLSEAEQQQFRGLYQTLRAEELPHSEAVRKLLARVLVAPAFLYRGERPPSGPVAAPVNGWELATRLSYFLWSAPPDEALAAAARDGSLGKPEVLVAQTRRMLKDPRVRRLATEFGCQWLQVRDLETLDEKSERHFPSFASVRGAMQEESVRFFMELFQENRSVLSLISADHTFVNANLAAHYGLDFPGNASSDEWRRTEGMQAKGRGGILGFASTLAKQSGASRTSPILRGNWLNEVVLGEKLPRPPKGVPVLPEEAPQGLTERQLIEKHSSDEACANCHRRIDPFGFALEGFDAIGRSRSKDAAGLPIDARTRLANGDALDGLSGLRNYILNQKRDEFLRQFCRKLLGYALGRSLQLSDKPLVDAMVARLNGGDPSVGGVIELIVCSSQFQQVRGRDYVASN